MPLVTSEAMLLSAQRAVTRCAFNVENMEMAQAVISAAEELEAPVMVQTTPSTVRYGSLALYRANVAALAQRGKGAGGHASGPRKQLRSGRPSFAGGIYLYYDRRFP